MSQENVEQAYRAFDVFNRRDLDGFLALMAEDVSADSRLAPMKGGYHGHDGIRRWWKGPRGIRPAVSRPLSLAVD